MSGPRMREHRQAIASLRSGDWRAAHGIVQKLDDPLAWRIHGLCHRVEGDLGNARYWYRKARVKFDPSQPIEDERRELERALKRGA